MVCAWCSSGVHHFSHVFRKNLSLLKDKIRFDVQLARYSESLSREITALCRHSNDSTGRHVRSHLVVNGLRKAGCSVCRNKNKAVAKHNHSSTCSTSSRMISLHPLMLYRRDVSYNHFFNGSVSPQVHVVCSRKCSPRLKPRAPHMKQARLVGTTVKCDCKHSPLGILVSLPGRNKAPEKSAHHSNVERKKKTRKDPKKDETKTPRDTPTGGRERFQDFRPSAIFLQPAHRRRAPFHKPDRHQQVST